MDLSGSELLSGGIFIIGSISAAYAYYRVKAADAWRSVADANAARAEAAAESATAWRTERDAAHERAERVSASREREQALLRQITEQNAELKQLTNLTPVIEQNKEFHAEIAQALRSISDTQTHLAGVAEAITVRVKATTDGHQEVTRALKAVSAHLEKHADNTNGTWERS